MLKNISKVLSQKLILIVIVSCSLIGFTAFIYYFSHGQLNLAYGDAQSRLNIARKLIDNLTPGFAQLGNIWLPLPQIFMLPLIWNSFLWHTGLAGYFMSGISFILLSYFLYKTGEVAFDSKLVGLITLAAGMNINLLYMQTTAMSEVFFIMAVTGATYFLLNWAKNEKVLSLMAAGVFVSASTLARYEGYFVAIAAFMLVIAISLIKYRKLHKVEGVTILFSSLAFTGIILWALYSALIFKDPFYWKAIYSGEKSIISTDVTEKKVITDDGASKLTKRDLLFSIKNVWDSSAWMNGVILVTFSTIGVGVFVIEASGRRWFTKKPYLLTLFLPASAILFVLFTVYSGGIPLDLPTINLHNLMTKETSFAPEYNIRYGMNMLPFVAIFIGYFATKGKIGKTFAVLLILAQFITTFWTPLATIYQLPIKLAGKNSSSNNGKIPASIWLKENYDGGLIMISALKHDPEMFYMGLDYKKYIHEGAGKYWIDSRDNPQKYATWIFMTKSGDDPAKSGDSVTKYLGDNPNVETYYNQAYSDSSYIIYKIKTQPEIIIKN